LLMETERKAFPPHDRLFGQLCGVRLVIEGQPVVKLGAVEFAEGSEESGPPRLELDTFDLGIDPSQIVEEEVVRKFRGKERRFVRKFKIVDREDGGQEKKELHDWDLEPILARIEYDDIVAVCITVLRRRVRANMT